MTMLNVYDPPGCCATGACSPEEDDELAQFASALEKFRKAGIEVNRFNLGHEPGAFVENATVKSLLDSDGMECLPMIMIDDEVVSKGGYISLTQLGGRLGVDLGDISIASAGPDDAEPKSNSSCCG